MKDFDIRGLGARQDRKLVWRGEWRISDSRARLLDDGGLEIMIRTEGPWTLCEKRDSLVECEAP